MVVLDLMVSANPDSSDEISITSSVSLPKSRRFDWLADSDDFLVYSRRQRDAEFPVEYDV